MKRIILVMSLVAIGFAAISQDCKTYIPTTVGAKLETQYFNKKEKLTSTSTSEVIKAGLVEGRFELVVETESVDTDGVSSGKSELTYYCDGDVFVVDMESMLDQNQMSAYENMEVKYTTENLYYPANLTVGTKIPNGFVEAVVYNEDIKMVTMRVDVRDVKVEAIESITVPAGTFEAAKISQTIVSKTGFITITMTSIQWMVEGIGAVRTETYNKKGKMFSSSVVSKID